MAEAEDNDQGLLALQQKVVLARAHVTEALKKLHEENNKMRWKLLRNTEYTTDYEEFHVPDLSHMIKNSHSPVPMDKLRAELENLKRVKMIQDMKCAKYTPTVD